MKLNKINYDKIINDIELESTRKALEKILSTKVEIKEGGFKIDNKIYNKKLNLCNTLFSSVLMSVLNDRHGEIFCWHDFDKKKAEEILEEYKYNAKLKFLSINHIDGTPENFKESIKTHILKRYGLE